MSLILTQSLLQDAPHYSNYEWKSLISIVFKPLLLSCPMSFYESFWNPFFSLVLNSISDKLHSEWECPISIEESELHELHEAEDQDDISDEIYNEMIKRQFTRSFSDLLSCVFERSISSGKTNLEYLKQFKRWEWIEFILNDFSVSFLFIFYIFILLFIK